MFFDFISDFFLQLTQFVAGLEPWQQIGALILISAIPFIESHLGAFLGVLVGIDPFIAVPAAVIGNALCTFLLIAAASRVRTAATRNRDTAVAEPSKRRQKVAKYLNRFGVPGVSLLTPLVLPNQITAPTLVALGANKRSVYLWIGISIIAWGILFGFFSNAVVTWVIR